MKRKILFLSLFIIMIIMIGTKRVNAATASVSWTADKTQAVPGQNITVTLAANSTDGINGLYTVYNYDSNVLELQSANVVDSEKWENIGTTENNEIVILAKSSTIIQSANLFVLNFKVKDNAQTDKSTTINTGNITVSTFASSNSEIVTAGKSSSVNIVKRQVSSIKMKTSPTNLTYVQKYGKLSLAGGVITATYNDGSSADINLTDSNVSTSGFNNSTVGEQTITVTYQGKSTTFKVNVLRLGDVNFDGVIDIKDIFSINKHRLNKVLLTGNALLVADVNNDGKADILDIFQINKFRLGRITSL